VCAQWVRYWLIFHINSSPPDFSNRKIAGISLGPFADYKSRLFSGSAGELFEFADPESVVSKKYEDSLRVALKYGVRVTFCGSIDDQLVSIEVCICRPFSYPTVNFPIVIHFLNRQSPVYLQSCLC
jgi:hypothetical protein